MERYGSFTNIRGGWAYPGLVRKTKDKPNAIKVYLQDGKDDLNNLHGNWPLSNRTSRRPCNSRGTSTSWK